MLSRRSRGMVMWMIRRLHVMRRRSHQGRSLNVIRIAHRHEYHNLPSSVERGIDRLGMLPLHKPLSSNRGNGTIPIRRRPNDKKRRILRLQNRRGTSPSGSTPLKIIHRRRLLIPEHILRQFLLPLRSFRTLALLPRLGIFPQLGFSVGEMTSVPERTVPAQKVLAEGNLIKLVRLGRRSPHRRNPVLPRLHLTQPQSKIRHHRQIGPLPPDVPIPAKRPVDAKSLTVKDALQAIRLADVTKRTILDFAAIPVATQGHLGQIVLMQKLARRALHAEIAEPVATDDGAEAGVVFGGGEDRLGFFSGGEDGAGLAVGEGVERFGDALGEGVVFEVVFDHVEGQGGRF
mmetsp:Transcript_1127/g.2306  ORF Transcript_1127/g.2306 Transcript_1127/m.2306 type:complete len:345 (-) Transcript_1127:285-1319(-)